MQVEQRRLAGRGIVHLTGLIALVATAGPGCLVVVEPDPAGESSISATWTIDGGPPTPAACSAAGIDTVELALFARGGASPLVTFTSACSAGTIDSRSTSTVILAGDYEVAFAALRAGGVVARTDRSAVRLIANDHTRVSTNFTSGTHFDPRGPDATAQARWTVEGRAPTAASCAALGIAEVRIAFQNGSSWYEHPDLVVPCSVGEIDTRPTPVIRAGNWILQVQALNAGGAIVAQGMAASLNVTNGSHVVMEAIDFRSAAFQPMGSDASVEARWALNTRMPTTDSCFAVGIDRVRVVLFAATDTAFENGVPVVQVQCAQGRLDSRPMRVIRAGRYLWALEAIGADGRIVSEYSEMTPIDIPVGSHLELPLVDFMFPTTLTIALEWQAPTGGAYTTCAAAGVARYSYTLRRDGAIVATADLRPCQDLVSFDMATTSGFAPGRYALYFEGFNGAGRKQWAVLPSTCDSIRVDNGALVLETCGAAFTP